MSHSKEQHRKKHEAREEAMRHQDSNVMNPRDGKDHEDHKFSDMADGMPQINMPPQGNGGGSK